MKWLMVSSFPVLIVYLFWGPLFPWSPIKPGYKRMEASWARVYMADSETDSSVYRLDEILKEEEAFHGLKFNEKFRIVILGKESNMKRYLPWLNGSGYSIKLGMVNVIYIGPNARTSPYGMEPYLKHEISHLLIHQNASSAKSNFQIQHQGWLTEGVATYFGGPHFYDRHELFELWTENGLAFDDLYCENPLEMGGRFKMKYTYYRFFIDYLISTYGLEQFQSYLRMYIRDPKKYQSIFMDVYGKDLSDILSGFKTYMSK